MGKVAALKADGCILLPMSGMVKYGGSYNYIYQSVNTCTYLKTSSRYSNNGTYAHVFSLQLWGGQMDPPMSTYSTYENIANSVRLIHTDD